MSLHIAASPRCNEPEMPEPVRSRSQVFFWTVLGIAASVSIVGNAVHAVLHAPAHPVVAVAVAVVPPVALLAAVHAVAVLSCAHAGARRTHLLATGMTVLIAAAAFRLSFTALRALAILAGIPADQAWLWPMIVEGSMTQATIALLAVTSARRVGTVATTAGAVTAVSAEPAIQACIDGDVTEQRAHGLHTSVRTPDPHVMPANVLQQAIESKWADVATRICNRDPAHRRDPGEVARILAWHYDDGLNPTQISRRIDLSRSTVSRIVNCAAQHHRPDQVAA